MRLRGLQIYLVITLLVMLAGAELMAYQQREWSAEHLLHISILLLLAVLFLKLHISYKDRYQEKALSMISRGKRSQRNNHALFRLASNEHIRNGDLYEAFEAIVKIGARRLLAAEASIWLFKDDKSILQCEVCFKRQSKEFKKGTRALTYAQTPQYFDIITKRRCVAIPSLHTRAFNGEFNTLYERGVRSLLDSPILVDGETVGVICFTDLKEREAWSTEDQALAASFADIAAMAIYAAEKKEYQSQLDQLYSAIEASVDGIAILDDTERYVYVNDAHARVYGYTSGKELVGKTWRVLYDDEVIDEFEREYMPRLQSEGTVKAESLARRADGSLFPSEVTLTALDTGGLICICRDVSERKQAEQEVADFSLFPLLNPNPEFRFDGSGSLCKLNPAAQELFDSLGKPVESLKDVFPGLSEDVVESCISKGQRYSETIEVRGRIFHFLFHGVPESGFGNAYGSDISALKDAERQLIASQSFLRTIIDLNPNLIFVKDRDGRFTLVNKAVAEVYGTTVDEIVGKKDSDFNESDEEVEEFRSDDLHVIDFLEELFIPEEQITDATGSIRYLQTVKIPLKIAGNNEYQVLGVATDITRIKELQEQLLQAQKMEAIGQLAGGIAHDFNNLLTGIMGYASLVLDPSTTIESARELGSKIEDAATKAAELTQKLLGFARQGKHQNVPIDIHVAIRDTVSMLSRLLEENIEIKSSLSAHRSIIAGDPTQIQQIILNLAINARDAMSPDLGGSEGGTLHIRTQEHVHDEHAVIEIVFEDTGCGMAEDIQTKAFEPFFTTKPIERGTGMGLAMVYGIVENHGGKITVSSSPGKGSRFSIILPLASDTDRARYNKNQKAPVNGDGVILLVDDHKIVRTVTAEMLSSLGYRVLTAPGGPEAIELYRKHVDEIDLVILDMVMPKMNADVVLTHLQKINPRVKAVLSTGYVDNDAVQNTMEQGMVGFVAKPYELSRLASVVAEGLAAPDAAAA